MEYHIHYSSNESIKTEKEAFGEKEIDKVPFKKKNNYFILLSVATICVVACSALYFSRPKKNNYTFSDSITENLNDDYIINFLLKSKNGKKFIVSKIEELMSSYDKNDNDLKKNGIQYNKTLKKDGCNDNKCVNTTTYMNNVETVTNGIRYNGINFIDMKYLMSNLETVNSFYMFMKEHGKQYNSVEEMQQKFLIFSENLKKVEAHNKSNSLYTKGLNRFSDLTYEEFENKYLTLKTFDLKKIGNKLPRLSEYEDVIIKYKKKDENFDHVIHDWRKLNAVTPVKDQKNCGSCWAFSTVGVVESQYAIRRKKLVQLSEQELIECSFKNNGCLYGFIPLAFDDMIEFGGLCEGKYYPYIDLTPELCDIDKCKTKYEIKTYVEIPQVRFKEAIRFLGPLSVSIAANDDFAYYQGGIFDGSCASSVNHAVIIVGYGMEEIYNTALKIKEKHYYYIIRNSWGKKWGEKGYMRIKTDEFGLLKTCLLGAQAFTAIIDDF
ncbi:vivapain-3, putative [Plasmodium malariae]|uniref:Vivapain-3, putative n=1 Tax=Plasmodium malariae TaxID=5858 RepID=A0A1C3KCE2_PLAMA|nr:vivapain-3, putative [Plasmodium malariae]